jgi:hypothetical protein
MSRRRHHVVASRPTTTSTAAGGEAAPTPSPDGMTVALAEFNALREEILSARTAQGAVLGAGLTVVAVVLTVTFNNLDQSGQSRLLAAIPPLSLLITVLNLSQAVRIQRIGRYIRVKLWPYVQERSGYPHSWEQEHHASALRGALLFDSAPVGLLFLLALGATLYSWSEMSVLGRAASVASIGLLITVQAVFVLRVRQRDRRVAGRR